MMNRVAVNFIKNMKTCPKQIAFYFWDPQSRTYHSITNEDLLFKSQNLAQQLRQAGLAHQSVILAIPQGLDFVCAALACLFAEIVFIPVHPIKIKSDLTRLDLIAQASLTRYVLLPNTLGSHAIFREPIGDFFLETLKITSTPHVMPKDLCFLQYSSGTTHKPKGIMISENNLRSCLDQMTKTMALSPEDHGCMWVPPYQDLGLIGGIFLPLYVGFPLTLMSSRTFIVNPLKWLEIITEQRVTITAAPNFAYDLVVDRFETAAGAELDLKSLKIALNAAERIKPRTIERFQRTFQPYGFLPQAFYPAYGLSEATLMVTAPEPLQPLQIVEMDELYAGENIVCCGKPMVGVDVQILKEGRTCDPGHIGEIFLAGESISQGYWNDSPATQERFKQRVNHSVFNPKYYFKTGDLGFMDEKGALFVIGRKEDQIWVKGQLYLLDLMEDQVLQLFTLDALYKTVAFLSDVKGQEELHIMQEVPFVSERFVGVMEQAANHIFERFQIPSLTIVLVKRGDIPKTVNGKIKRHAAKVLYEHAVIDILSRKTFSQMQSNPKKQFHQAMG
jgi:acyl-CoA synthetase (AMP-forming)/AMP-acid ligase II